MKIIFVHSLNNNKSSLVIDVFLLSNLLTVSMFGNVFVSRLRGLAEPSLVDGPHPPFVHLAFSQVAEAGLTHRLRCLVNLEEIQVVFSLLLDNIMRNLPAAVKSRRLPSQKNAEIVKTLVN